MVPEFFVEVVKKSGINEDDARVSLPHQGRLWIMDWGNSKLGLFGLQMKIVIVG